MKATLYAILILQFVSVQMFAQELDWLKNSTYNGNFATSQFFASTQHNDDFYFAGDLWPNLTIDGVNIEIADDIGDGFIVRMDESGLSNALWHFKSNDYVRINAIEVNPITGNLIVTGYFRADMEYNGEVWTTPFYQNGILMSIYPDGTLDWIKEFENQNNLSFAGGEAMAIDDMGNIFVGLAAAGDITIDGQDFSLASQAIGAMIAKFNSSGDLIATDIWGNTSIEGSTNMTALAIDDNNDVIAVGCINGTMETADSTYSFPFGFHPFIIKVDNNLNMQWIKSYENTRGHILDVLVDEEDLILSLQYHESIDIDGNILIGSGSWTDMAILSMDENAELNWVKNFPLSENYGNWGISGRSIINWMDEYYIAGMYQGDVLHEGSLILNNSPIGGVYQYPFILSLNEDGEITSTYDFLGSNEPSKINTISASETHLLFGGDFSGQVSIGDSSVNTINGALFYGALKNETIGTELQEDTSPSFTIFPTLTSDFITIDSEAKIRSLYVTSPTGELLKEFSGSTRIVDVNNMAGGVYYLSADIDGEIMTVKFIKQQ